MKLDYSHIKKRIFENDGCLRDLNTDSIEITDRFKIIFFLEDNGIFWMN